MPVSNVPPEIEKRLPVELQMETLRKIPGAPGKGRRGASGEYLAAIRARKKALETLDPEQFKSGRPRINFTRAEVEEHAIEKMLPRALVVISEQLDSPDEKVRQSAAVKVLEYVKGKPTQVVQQELSQVTRIVYESAAFRPEMIEAAEVYELPPAPELDDVDPIEE